MKTTYEVWSGAPLHALSLKLDKITEIVRARSLCEQLARDGMIYEIISQPDGALVETNAAPSPPVLTLDIPNDFRDRLLQYLRDIAGELADEHTLEQFIDMAADGFDEAQRSHLAMGFDEGTVCLAYGFLIGACSAMKIPMHEMFTNEGIDLGNLESSH